MRLFFKVLSTTMTDHDVQLIVRLGIHSPYLCTTYFCRWSPRRSLIRVCLPRVTPASDSLSMVYTDPRCANHDL